MRDRLIELLEAEGGFSRYMTDDERRAKLADRLLAAGVIVPPLELGRTVYHLTSEEVFDVLNCAEIYEGKVFSMSKDGDGVWLYCRYDNGLNYWYSETDIGKLLFLTREEAEKALAERTEG